MDEPNNLALTRVVWLSMSKHEKTSFLKENSTLIFDDAANNMHLIPEKGSVCMVCVVEALSQDPSAANSTHKLVNILNRFMGETWSKPSKRKKHCVTRNHVELWPLPEKHLYAPKIPTVSLKCGREKKTRRRAQEGPGFSF